MEMRKALVEGLKKLMLTDDKIVVLDADLAKATGTIALQKDFSDRAMDVGIAEQNMTSIAAGLSSYGYKPYITSFTPFVTRRACDQVALSCCYAKQNVKIIGTDPGISAEINGGTHMGIDDIGALRSIPEIVIFEPCDEMQIHKALPVIDDYYGTVYIRLFRKESTPIFDENYKFDLFTADKIKDGSDVSIFATGIMVAEAVKAYELLKEIGINAEIINVHTIKPIDSKTVIESIKKTNCAVVAENHNTIGGLYSAICEVVCENYPVPLKKVGIVDRFGEVGKMPYLKELYNMRAEDIVNQAKAVIKLKSR